VLVQRLLIDSAERRHGVRMRSVMIERAAWVPDDVFDRPWDEAAALAVDWIEAECAERGETPLLVTNTKSALSSGHELLVQFARRHAATTPATAEGFGQWPALVYVPDDKTFAFAQDHARGSALAVVEGQLLPSQRGP